MTRSRLILLALAATASLWLLPAAVRWLRVDTCLDQGGRWNYDVNDCETAEDASRSEPGGGASSARAALANPVCVDSAATREARILAALATAEQETRPQSDSLRLLVESVSDSAGGVIVRTVMRDGSLATDRFPRILVPRQGCARSLSGDSL